MSTAKIGDTVRFLNSVGGGRVVRIADGIAYVDDDGFETPVLLRECVVVKAASPSIFDAPAPAAKASPAPKVTAAPASTPTQLPVVETRTGNALNLVLGFVPVDITTLSRTSFEAYLVNDSNYYIYLSVASRATDDAEWTLRYDGLIEPNIQEFLFELEPAELSRFDRLAVQYVAFKRGRDYELKSPGRLEIKVETTKFARLHCFRANPYFDGKVIAYDVAVNDAAPAPVVPDAEKLVAAMVRKDVAAPAPAKSSKPSQRRADSEPIVVDLHAEELLDDTRGLSPADILNMQVDRFCAVMDENLRHIGRKIVFIHGKGEGVLRQAIMKELNHRYKGHDVQDASFREYGFGATQVTIRNTDNAHKDGRKSHQKQYRK